MKTFHDFIKLDEGFNTPDGFSVRPKGVLERSEVIFKDGSIKITISLPSLSYSSKTLNQIEKASRNANKADKEEFKKYFASLDALNKEIEKGGLKTQKELEQTFNKFLKDVESSLKDIDRELAKKAKDKNLI